MLGIILGKGGESLGSTFWGQTELSCYDDAQHGIWGMSYKYHERAIVINERNLVRLWDVAYDGYVGGKDDRVLNWQSTHDDDPNNIRNFRDSTGNVSKNYHGASMMVMAFVHQDPPNHRGGTSWKQNWPSPMLFHDPYYYDSCNLETGVWTDAEKTSCIQTKEFRVFDRSIPGYARYHDYFQLMPEFTSLALQGKPAGPASSENEVTVDMMAYQGSLRVRDVNGTVVDEVNGSGHHGHDFVGVASLRAGKGFRIQSQPQLARAA